MAQTRNKIPFFESISNTATLDETASLPVKLQILYNQGVRVINQSNELLNQYWSLPNIKIRNGSTQGNNPLQICFILKLALDHLKPSDLVKEAKFIQEAASNLLFGVRAVNFQNGSILLGQEALVEIFYTYIRANPTIFLNEDLNLLENVNFYVRYFHAFLGKNSTLPFTKNPDSFFSFLHKLLMKEQTNVNAYFEFAHLVFPDQMPKYENAPTTTAQILAPITSQPSSLFSQASPNTEQNDKAKEKNTAQNKLG